MRILRAAQTALICLALPQFLSVSIAAESSLPVRIGLTKPIRSVDPYNLGVVNPSMFTRVLETLATVPIGDPEGLQAALAVSWLMAKDKRSVEVTLREGVRWHDGRPLTSADILFTFNSWHNDKHQFVPNYVKPIERVEIIDERRFRLHFKSDEWFGFRSALVGMEIMPKHVYEGLDKKGRAQLGKIVGSGPYRFRSFTKGKEVVLEVNPDWWGAQSELPYYRDQQGLPAIAFRHTTDTTVATQMIRQGQLDVHVLMTEADVTVAEKLAGKDPKLQIVTGEKRRGIRLFFNMNSANPILKDVRVRQALNQLWDREEVNEKLFGGKYVESKSVFLENTPFIGDTPSLEYDPESALSLLKAAGWEDTDKDGLLDKEVNGKRIPLRLSLKTGHANTEKMMSLYQTAARKLGIQIDTQTIERNGIPDTIDEGRFDLFAHIYLGLNILLPRGWHSETNSEYFPDPSPEVDKLLRRLEREFDPKQRRELSRKAQEAVDKLVPYVLGFETDSGSYLTSARLEFPEDEYRVEWEYWRIKKSEQEK